MSTTQVDALSEIPFAPGVTVLVRDEEWLITSVERAAAESVAERTPYLIRVRGISRYVRDTTASFYTDLDDVTVLDPAASTVVADPSPHYRRSRLFLESTLRRTPTPIYDEEIQVAGEMLMDTLGYQLSAVRKALSNPTLRPRLLIADAVGLGKTLEIGMILAELVRRGRGERILVVTPRHVLEQMQQELWCRFALPLVRLDSVGIQKVRQKLPATRNPFTYFPRVIVSIDTLKSAKYRAQLEKVRWDAVVIDEVHNATNSSTQNNELARILAPTTEALLLASATPHNGRPESFAELLRLLDPTVVKPDGSIARDDLEKLIIRRHRYSAEVAAEVGEKWAERAEPNNILVPASPEETALAREIRDTWTHPEGSPPSGDNALFSWTLAKAFLSSPAALLESVANRRARATGPREIEALDELQRLAEQITPTANAKYRELLSYLKQIGVGRGKAMRAVVFTERVATIHWLQAQLAKDLGFKPGAVRVMHGGLPDQEQMELIDAFKRESSPVRVLVTGDVASEGVNLHRQCHQLVHYDIPWSLIRIQQRNGRVDRYGQETSPVITTLLLDPPDDAAPGDLHLLTKLMEREHEAHARLGDVASLMGEHSEAKEEDAIRKVLARTKSFDDVVKTPDQVRAQEGADADDLAIDDIDAWIESLSAGVDDDSGPSEPTSLRRRSFYDSELAYLEDALTEAYNDDPQFPPARGGVGWRRNDNSTAQLEPPADLARRLDLLPQDYVADRQVKSELMLATTTARGAASLDEAREGSSESTWPIAHYLGPLHLVSEWAADRALAELGRQEVPAVRGNVDHPTVLLIGTLMNKRGQVISRAFQVTEFHTAEFATDQTIEDPYEWLRVIGLSASATNPGPVADAAELTELIPRAVATARASLGSVFNAATVEAERRVKELHARSGEWALLAAEETQTSGIRRLTDRVRGEAELADQLAPEQSLVRPVLVVVPPGTPAQ
ncbi:DEAD/DEAH box helicase [Gordonia zhaorongruii]|uniref:DEAD/DEAH box helicase n=1 Tax=Gordonia zhaorongruii TaxID=2597659 RepID=UPI001FD4FC50|nr:DEAD/DEAH box helicase [Gordonia zhaorongruii]